MQMCHQRFPKTSLKKKHLLEKHKMEEHGRELRPISKVECLECKKECLTREALRGHDKMCHKMIDCPECNESVKKVALVNHRNSNFWYLR